MFYNAQLGKEAAAFGKYRACPFGTIRVPSTVLTIRKGGQQKFLIAKHGVL